MNPAMPRWLFRSANPLRGVIGAIPLSISWIDSESRYIGCNAFFARARYLGLSHKSRLP